MGRSVLVFAVLLAGCSSAPSRDIQYIRQARSIGAAWALINEQAAQKRLTPTYVASMHVWLRQQLKATSASLTQPDSRYGKEIQALLRQPDDVAPEELRAHVDKLKDIEKQLESA